MSIRYPRAVRVIVGDPDAALQIEDLLIVFEIRREANATPASGEITIYNLNESNETRIRLRGQRVQLYAGYAGQLNLLADGEVRRVYRERKNLDRVTRIAFGGKIKARRQAMFNHSYDGPVPLRDVVRNAVAAFKTLTLGPLNVIPADAIHKARKYSHPAETVLTAILRPHNIRWYEDNGVVRFTRIGQSSDDRRGADSVRISEQTGMVGSPSVTDDGIRVRTLLDPRLGLDTRIRVESAVLTRAASGDRANERAVEQTGDYKIVTLVHQGDNRMGDFYTDIEARPITAQANRAAQPVAEYAA